MSDTPRCDSTAIGFDDDTRFHLGSTVWFVPADFARQLERELSAAKAERDALSKMLDRVAREGFKLDDTIGGEPYDDYLIRMIEGLKYELRAADAEINRLMGRST